MSTITSSGGTVYILYVSGTFQYQINSTSGSWTTISSWPVTINNTSGSSTLTVSFTGNATFTTSSQFFITGSNNITYDGNNKTMTISSVIPFYGLIRNGTSGSSGYNNVTCQNFIISNSSSTLDNLGGWLCQNYFGKGATGCIITNCSSNGSISTGSGGIVGAYCGVDSGSVTISKCYSIGNGTSSGGIAGNGTGNNAGNVTITNCYTNGPMTGSSGGIIGSSSGTSGVVNISNCYTSGNMVAVGSGTGGIVGSSSGVGGTITVSNCYSRGSIASGCGGIVGASYGNVICTNCYTSGVTGVSNQNGIYAGSSSDNPLGSNNYSEANNGTSGWNNTNASAYLLNGPVGYVQGSVWSDINFTVPNNPWFLTVFNSQIYSPNTATITPDTIYTTGSSVLTGTFNQIITVNDSITYSDISINSTTGVITFTNKPNGTYVVSVLNLTITPSLYNYNINTFTLTVSSGPTPGSSTMNYYSSKNGALNQDSSKLLGSSSSSYQVGNIDSGSLGNITRWKIASNSTGSSSQNYVYTNDVVLNHQSSPVYYLYPARFKKSLRPKRVLNQSYQIVPEWEGYQYYVKKANRFGFSRLFYSTYIKKYKKNH